MDLKLDVLRKKAEVRKSKYRGKKQIGLEMLKFVDNDHEFEEPVSFRDNIAEEQDKVSDHDSDNKRRKVHKCKCGRTIQQSEPGMLNSL